MNNLLHLIKNNDNNLNNNNNTWNPDQILEGLDEVLNNLNLEEDQASETESNATEDLEIGDIALNNAATAITNLAAALGQGSEKALVKIEPYRGDGTQDPITWIEEFDRAAQVNRWNAERQLELACAYMKDNAQEWLQSLAN